MHPLTQVHHPAADAGVDPGEDLRQGGGERGRGSGGQPAVRQLCGQLQDPAEAEGQIHAVIFFKDRFF